MKLLGRSLHVQFVQGCVPVSSAGGRRQLVQILGEGQKLAALGSSPGGLVQAAQNL